MATRQSRYPIEEVARRGTEIYEQQVRRQVASGNKGRYVTIDIDTGDFEMADTLLESATGMQARRPDAQTWTLRIGYKAARHFSPPLDPEEA